MEVQVVLTVSESKRLIAKGVAAHEPVLDALENGIIAVCKGTTNSYVAEELLGQEIPRNEYVTGSTFPKGSELRKKLSASYPDVVLEKGKRLEGVTAVEAVKNMSQGDVFIKGANAINYELNQAAILVGHPTGGTLGATIGTVISRRITLLTPVGIEKNIPGNLYDIAEFVAEGKECSGVPGGRASLWPFPTELFTEIEAFEVLCNVDAVAIGSGGVGGAEGAVRFSLQGEEKDVRVAVEIVESIQGEPPFVT